MDPSSPVRIQVSRNVLHWPAACACCHGPAEVRCALSLGSGWRQWISKSQQGWSVPYCSECLGHAARYTLARQIRHRGRQACVVVFLGSAVIMILIWVIAMRYLMQFVGERLAQAFTLAVGAALIVLTYQVAKEVLARSRQEAARAEERGQNLLRHSCANRGMAVAYRGRQGAAHTFELYNPRFAADFRRANGVQRVG